MAPPRVLITFDIDGTLLQSAGPFYNLLYKRCFHFAYKTIYDKEADIEAINYHGLTDPQILVATLLHYGMHEDTIKLGVKELLLTMQSFANTHTYQIKEGLEIHPGVVQLLDCLSKRDDVVLGVVTGNLKQLAWMKLAGLGIKQFFTSPQFGAFGDDISPYEGNKSIGNLVQLAGARATELYEGGFRLRVHVGDTPQDIQGAEQGGALPIGVCTNIHSKDELLQASTSTTSKPTIFYELTDIEGFLEACTLLGPGKKH